MVPPLRYLITVQSSEVQIMKKLLVGVVVLGLFGGSTFASTESGNLKFSGVSLIQMSQSQAQSYCLRQGGHLPSDRELALYGQAHGAKGIRETKYPGTNPDEDTSLANERVQMEQGNFYPVYGRDSSGNFFVKFYFNFDGYRAESDIYLWSSSTDGLLPEYAEVFPWGTASIDVVPDGHIGVTCVIP
jgi:hypothetical protein